MTLSLSSFGTTRCILTAVMLTLCPSLFALETVAITEYMNDTSIAETSGEWVELHNFGNATVTLTSWRLRDDGTDSIQIPDGTQIPPHQFLVLARSKSAFEALWLNSVPDNRVVQFGTGTFAMSNTGGDEIVLLNAASQTVWRLAYGANDSEGRATFYAMDNLATAPTNHGTGTQLIQRAGNDAATSALGYQGNEFTEDLWAYPAGKDFGSPLRGTYTGALNPAPSPTSWSLDLSTKGTSVSAGVRGIAIADQALDRTDNSDKCGIIPSLERARGSAIRGVAGGLYADMYDWKKRNDMPRPPTLEFQRWARDYNAELYVTANIRGLTVPDATSPTTHRMYYTTDTATLVKLAADWVRYSNHIVPTYRQGDTISDPKDAAILGELTWSSSYVNEFGTADNFSTLLAPGEAAVPPVEYWEIGNEPTVTLANAYNVTNAYVFTSMPGEFRDRYVAITNAMLAEDPTIKVGPCVVNGRAGNNATMLATLLQSSAKIDFISYHPYGSMNDYLTLPLRQQEYLGTVYTEQSIFLQEIKNLVAQYRPNDVSKMEYVASETNVSDFRTNNQFQEASMSHALGSVESVLSWGRLGLRAAHYWIWITHMNKLIDPSDWRTEFNRYPVSMAFEKMRDELGDELIGCFDTNPKVHAYTIRDTATGIVKVWALNFSNAQNINFHFSFGGAGSVAPKVSKQVFGAVGGGTSSLFSANLPYDIAGGPKRDVNWSEPVEIPNANITNMDVSLPSATITLLTIENLPSAAVKDWSDY